jgi:hypothetical protein
LLALIGAFQELPAKRRWFGLFVVVSIAIDTPSVGILPQASGDAGRQQFIYRWLHY